jgi:hypothetical protein
VDKVLHCDCGFEARAANEDGLVAEVQRHAREAHGMALSSEQALLLAFRAELNETTTPRKSVHEAGDGTSEDDSSDTKEEEK